MHESGMDIPAVLRGIAERAKVRQSGLGDLIGLSQPQISRLMKGSEPKKPTYDKIMDAARRYGVLGEDDLRSEDVAANIDRPPQRMVKVKGYVGAGGQAHTYNVAVESDLGEIEPSDRDPPQAVAVQIMGTSLGRFFDRWYAIYNDVRAPITDDLIGHLCVVGLEDDRVLIKKVQRSGSRFDLLSNDPAEEPIRGVTIKWAAKVTDIRQG